MLMDDCSFQISIGLRSGSQLYCDFTCACGETVGQQGLHPLSCPKNADQHFRHTEENTTVDLN